MAKHLTTLPVDLAALQRGRLRSLVGADMALVSELHADDFQLLTLWSQAAQVDG